MNKSALEAALLPCPFCGDPMELRHTIIRHTEFVANCPIAKMTVDHLYRDRWNRRSPAPAPAETEEDRALANFDKIADSFFASNDAVLAALLPSGSAEKAGVVGFDFLHHLHRQREWSSRTFGPGTRAKGVVDHIRKELLEIEADPADLMEWVDVTILALDGAWRSGASPEQIIETIIAKQTKNEGRQWPDWRTASPDAAIEHVKQPPAPTPPSPATGEA